MTGEWGSGHPVTRLRNGHFGRDRFEVLVRDGCRGASCAFALHA